MSKLGIWVDFDAKIVCNELRRQGLVSFDTWLIDARYCKARFCPTTYQGYRLWALPCLRLMRQHAGLARMLATAVRWMSADMAYQGGLRCGRHWRGWLVHRCIFWPANWLLGLAVSACKVVSAPTSAPRRAIGARSASWRPFITFNRQS